MQKLEIDVVSDMVCPWCFIGTRRLSAVLGKHAELDAVVRYHPFELDPSIPEEGGDLRALLKKKYGGDIEAMFGRVETAAKGAGIPLDFSKVRRYPSTIAAHTLSRAAKERGTQRALVEAIFSAYFLEGRDIGARDVLVSLASAHGFTEDEASALLADDAARAATRADARRAAEEGVTGVPFFVFAGRVAFGGAQPEAIFEKALAQAR